MHLERGRYFTPALLWMVYCKEGAVLPIMQSLCGDLLRIPHHTPQLHPKASVSPTLPSWLLIISQAHPSTPPHLHSIYQAGAVFPLDKVSFHLFNSDLLSTSRADTLLALNTALDKAEESPAFMEMTVWGGMLAGPLQLLLPLKSLPIDSLQP